MLSQRLREFVASGFHAEHHARIESTLHRLPAGFQFTGGSRCRVIPASELGGLGG